MSIRPSARPLVFSAFALPVTAVSFADVSGLEEIVVTARRVEERIQDIPMSVQVLSGDYLDDADLHNLFELQFNVPGLVVNNLGGHGAGFSLRGISDQGGSSLSVASHFNGIYLGKSSLAIARLFDMDRIEVLKGPQGTLYGRNSTGGSINFVTRAPGDFFKSGIEAAVGSFNTARVQGFVNLPSEKVDFRLAVIGSEGDGFIRNTVDDRRFAEDDFWGLRASLSVDLSSRVSFDVVAQRVADDGASGELWLPNPAFLPEPADLRLTTVTLADPYLKTLNEIAGVTVAFDLGFATLRSVTGYARSEVDDKDDCAGLPVLQGCVRIIGPDMHAQRSQEFQLVSGEEAAVDWLAGAYVYDADATSYHYLLTPQAGPIPQHDEFATSDESASAIYGELTVRLAERWSVTGGSRYSTEKSRISNVGTGIQDNPTLTSATNDWNQLSWQVNVKYAARENLLAYAGISTGFKSGGFADERLPGGEISNYKPENLLAYEAGIKSQWLARRLTLNSAAFFYDFSDLQVSTIVIDGVIVYPRTDNAAKAEIYGIDTSATYAATDRLTLSGSAIWLPKRDFVDYLNDQTGDTLSGNKLSRVPEWTASASVDYAHPLQDRGELSARLEYNYRTDYFYTKENTPMFWQDGFGLLNVFLQFTPGNENWYLFASGRNLTGENYFTQVFIQSSPGYPVTWEAGFGLQF